MYQLRMKSISIHGFIRQYQYDENDSIQQLYDFHTRIHTTPCDSNSNKVYRGDIVPVTK